MHPERPLTPTLDPPAGGLDGLRHRLHRHDRRRQTLAAAATIAVVAVAVALPSPAPREPLGGDHPLVRLADEAPREAVRVVDGTAVEWAASTPNTRIYLVATGQ